MGYTAELLVNTKYPGRSMNKAEKLAELQAKWEGCTRCPLHKTRRNIVFGEGNPNADLMLIGTGPGDDEDKLGRPYRGKSGYVLNQFLDGARLSRTEDVYITNIVCCYPQLIKEDERTGKKFVGHRDPKKEERLACSDRLMETIYIVDPLLIVAFGKPAMQALTGKGTQTARLHGEIQTMHMMGRKTEVRYPVFPTYELGQLADSSDHTSPTALWEPTVQDFSNIVNILDYLREKYYGVVPPDAEDEPSPKPRKVQDGVEEEEEDQDRED
jgi:DNA polymerase